MRRREFFAALGAVAATWPFASRAEQRVPRIGYLSPVSAADTNGFGVATRCRQIIKSMPAKTGTLAQMMTSQL